MQECGDCTLCCRLLEITEAGSSMNDWCKHCDPKSGCKAYDSRPGECKTFNCSWKLHDGAHADMRPDKAKVIFENLDVDIVFGTVHPDYPIKKLVWKQIYSFMKQGSSVVLYNAKEDNKPILHLTDGAEAKEVWGRVLKKRNEIEELRIKRNDSTKLHN